MANPGYVRSTDGNDADDGSTWALANATITGAMTDAAAGDRIWISDAHNESTAGAVTITAPGTIASPNQILFGDDAAEPPTALSSTGTISTTGANSIIINGSFYWYGGYLIAGSGASAGSVSTAQGDGNHQTYDSVNFVCGNTNSTSRIRLGFVSTTVETSVNLNNCTFKFGATTQGMRFEAGKVRIRGGSLDATTSAISNFIATVLGGPIDTKITGFDMSAGAAAMNLIVTGSAGSGRIVFRDCKLPASWSGSLFGGAPANMGLRAEMRNCSAGDVNYAMWIEDISGSIKHETTIVKTGGASDGTTAIAWKMATGADADFPAVILVSPEIQKWNETTGSSVTVTVDIVHDSVTALQDDEIWLEIEYLGTSGFPLSLFADDAAANILSTPADQTSSSATWTTTGITNVNKQKLAVSFTPQEKGLIIARVCVAKASYTVYVDPELQIS